MTEKNYIPPKVEVIYLETADILTNSQPDTDVNYTWPEETHDVTDGGLWTPIA